MVLTSNTAEASVQETSYDRRSELKAFDDTNAGVKGLVDAGVSKVPRIFIHPSGSNFEKASSIGKNPVSIPVIDLENIEKNTSKRKDIVDKVRNASETLGFFQMVNHGIPTTVLKEMDAGVRRFFEQDDAVKKKFYTRDVTRKFVYNSNFDLHTAPVANWRDTFFSYMAPYPPKPEDLPEACRCVNNRFSV